MIGSAGIAAWMAQIAFWALIVVGVGSGDLGIKRVAIVVGLWLTGYIGLRFVPFGDLYLTSYLAVLDIALVFLIFKGDVRIG